MGKSSQTLRMLTNEQSLYRENTPKLGLWYKDPCFIKQAVTCNPKLYNIYDLHDENVQLHVHDTEDILKDAEDSRLKIKEKLVPINYAKINKLYETFVPQTELSLEQKYILDSSISNVTLEMKSPQKPSSPPNEMPKQSKMLVDETSKKHEILHNELDRLLEATLADDVRNLVMHSYVKI
ncbi:hypothetical protein Tco_0333508 [Tanacetum coccineum]